MSSKSDRPRQADRPKTGWIADFHRSENRGSCLEQVGQGNKVEE